MKNIAYDFVAIGIDLKNPCLFHRITYLTYL